MAATMVKVAGTEYGVERFRGLKAILAIAAVTRIGEKVPDILADAVKDYQQRHTIVVTEAMAKLPRWEGFSKEDFDAAEQESGKREIYLPAPMDGNEQILVALPALLERARVEVVRLLAILITPNEQLKEADKAGEVDQVLEKHFDLLMYEADLEELADLVLTAQDVVGKQLGNRKDRLGKLLGSLTGVFTRRAGQQLSTPMVTSFIPGQTQMQMEQELEEKIRESTSQTSESDAPISSTPSETLTGGPESTLSTELSGATS